MEKNGQQVINVLCKSVNVLYHFSIHEMFAYCQDFQGYKILKSVRYDETSQRVKL